MAIASSQNTKVGLIKEVTFATTPTDPQLLAQYQAETNFVLSQESIEDTVKTGFRQELNYLYGNKTYTGTITGQLTHGNYDTLLETAMFNTWATNTLSLGATRVSLSIEEAQADMDTPTYFLYTGFVGNTLTIDAPNNGAVTFTLEGLAMSETESSDSVSVADYTPYAAKTPFTSCRGVITEGGTPIAYVSGSNFSINNNLTVQNYWGDCDPGDLTEGRAVVEGTLTVFFVSTALYNKFVNGTSSTLSIQFSDGTNTLTFNFPKIYYTSGEKPSPAGSDPRTLTLGFRAVAPSVSGSAVTVTRSA